MEDIILKLALLFQTSAIGLGVGSSTLAITSFLVVLYDNQIDPSERRMIGVIYTTLRVAMVMILLTTVVIFIIDPTFFGVVGAFLWVLVGVLFVNAVLMTKHLMPVKFGPAIQAGTWYTLGFVMTIHMFSLMELTWTSFLALYAGDILFAYILVNGYLAWRKKQQNSQAAKT